MKRFEKKTPHARDGDTMLSRLFKGRERPTLPPKLSAIGTHVLYDGRETLCSKNPQAHYVVIA